MKRLDLNGYPIEDTIFRTKCSECGMPTLSYREFHPYEACEVYKKTHSSRAAWNAVRGKAPKVPA